jgi:hypothetical protein
MANRLALVITMTPGKTVPRWLDRREVETDDCGER